MAAEERSKRTKQGDEDLEDLELPVPDFDEEEWKRDEVRSAHQALIATTYGFALGSTAAVAQGILADFRIGWLVLLVGVAALRIVFRLTGIDVKEWGAKEWLGTYFMLFFSFLAAWYLLINPPFS